MIKIVFMGTPAFSAPILESLIEAGYDVQAIVMQPDWPIGRKRVIIPTPVREAVLKRNSLVLQPGKVSGSPKMEKVIDLAPDLVMTAVFGQSPPERTLKASKPGMINVYASFLPKYRDGTPIHHSIIKGEKEAGVTIMGMMKKMDVGAILSQRAIPITEQNDVGTMLGKLSTLGKELLLETLSKLIADEITPIPQMEEEATFLLNITRKQKRIDWQKTTGAIDNQVHGICPRPTTFTTYQGTNRKVWAVTPLIGTTTNTPGTTTQRSKKALWIACDEGTVLQIGRLQLAGKGQLMIQESLNGVGQNVTEKGKAD